MEKLDRDNDRMRSEIALLREELDEERDARKDTLRLTEHPAVTVEQTRRPRILLVALIAGVAYVLGTRAGQERYRLIVERARAVTDALRRDARTAPHT
jgi:hypothetical protein